MNLLLAGTWDDEAERDGWVAALRTALPAHTLLLSRDDAKGAIDAAIVANPPPGSLQGLPSRGSFRERSPGPAQPRACRHGPPSLLGCRAGRTVRHGRPPSG